MKTLLSWAKGVVVCVLLVGLGNFSMGCGGGGGGGSGGDGSMVAPGVNVGSSGQPAGGSAADGSAVGGAGTASIQIPTGRSASGRITFQLPDPDTLDFVRVYVGKQTRSYDNTFDLFEVQTMSQVASAMEPRLARILSEPGTYFVSLTVVDTAGRESAFSNEIRVEKQGNVASAASSIPQSPVWTCALLPELAGRRA